MKTPTYTLTLSVALIWLLTGCGESSAPPATGSGLSATHPRPEPCGMLSDEQIKAVTGIKPVSAEADSQSGVSCTWLYEGVMLGQPAELPLISISVVPQQYKVPESFDAFRTDFEEYMGQPWDGMVQVAGIGKYAWSDGQLIQVMTQDGTLVTVASGYKTPLNPDQLKQLAQYLLDRL
ncbi:MAG: hypothetical protein Kow0020_05790 [Wenzhouxiangellaceae bacterium]